MTSGSVGIVLSGGGARGAYEVGVIQGITQAVGPRAEGPPLFPIIAGTSVGALNGAWLAANAHRPGYAIGEFADVWRRIELREHLRIDPVGLATWASPLRVMSTAARPGATDCFGRSVLDPRALDALVRTAVDFPRLHQNVGAGLVRAFFVAALHIGTGVTTLFGELSPGTEFRPMKRPSHVARLEPIELCHVMASAAIPALFPARRIGRAHYVDGGLRFNTPLAPAIRAGARKLVVITLQPAPAKGSPTDGHALASEQYPSIVFLLGKLFNAVLADPITHDLQVLERFNQVIDVLGTILTPDERARVNVVLRESRGLPYRKIDTLAFSPSQDIGLLAGQYVREHFSRWRVDRFPEWLLAQASSLEASWEADLASYLLFDGAWADALIGLGRRDALARREEIRAFFEA